ncbi:hypothetical protein F4808DRAFT_448606 [Astrocystis sublimbata]|nr:hypothetical protein F4808DRAFT_448606 [Astrocystis sublimbata]
MASQGPISTSSHMSEGLVNSYRRKKRKPISCANCRRSKLRCDRHQPCASCLRKRCASSCAYDQLPGPARFEDPESRPEYSDVTVGGGMQPASVAQGFSAIAATSKERQLEPANTAASDFRKQHTLTHDRWEEVLRRPMNSNEPSAFAPDDTGSRATSFCFPFPSEPQLGKNDLLAMIPFASCDYLLSRWFMYMSQFFPILHGPTFQKEYAAFVADPSAVDFSWLALLFMLLSLGIHTLDYDGPLPAEINPNAPLLQVSGRLTRRYREAAMMCLSKAQFLTRYHLSTLQALLLVIYEICHEEGVEQGWTLLGIALNISIALHCNDESIPPNVSRIEIERRRRCWAGLLSLYGYQLVSHPGVDMYFLTDVAATMPADVDDADISEHAVTHTSRRLTQMSTMMFKVRLFQLSSKICRHLKGPKRLDEKTRDIFDVEITTEQRLWDATYLVDGNSEVHSLLDHSSFAHWSLQFHGHHLHLLIHQPFCRPRSNSTCFRQQSREKCITSGAALLRLHQRYWEVPRLKPWRWTLHGLLSFYAVHGAVALASCLLEEESHTSESSQYRDVFIAAVNRIGELQHRSPICMKAYPILSQLQALLFPEQYKWPNPSNTNFLETFDTWVDNLQWLNADTIDWNFLDGIVEDNNGLST